MSAFDLAAEQAADLAAEDARQTELYRRTLFLLDGLVVMERLREMPPVELEAMQLADAYRALLGDALPDANSPDLAEPGPHPSQGPQPSHGPHPANPVDIDVT
jgi:hypothetical protein